MAWRPPRQHRHARIRGGAISAVALLLVLAHLVLPSACDLLRQFVSASWRGQRSAGFRVAAGCAGASLPEQDSGDDEAGEVATATIVKRNLTVGQKVLGTVTKRVNNGIFLDVGAGKDGFVHITKLTYGRVENVDDVCEVGDEMDVWIFGVRRDGKIDLTCRPPVNLTIFEGVKKSEWLTATIRHIDWSGFYVTVQPPDGSELQEGKIRRREIRQGWVKNPYSEADVGDQVRVRILNVNATAGKMALTMRGMEPIRRPVRGMEPAGRSVRGREPVGMEPAGRSVRGGEPVGRPVRGMEPAGRSVRGREPVRRFRE